MSDEATSGLPSFSWENKQFLLKTIMNQLGITQDDLENDPSWVKAKVRESNIDKVLED
jgi:hypothetical protein